jgi:hypothetical protein
MNMRQSRQQEYGIESSPPRGREPFSPSHPVVSSTVAARSVSVGGSGREADVGLRQYRDSYALEESVIEPSDDDVDVRQSWMSLDEDASLADRESLEAENLDQEFEEPDDFDEILDRFEDYGSDNGDIPHLSGGHALERSHSFKAGKFSREEQRHPDRFNAELYNKFPTAAVDDVCGFEDDGMVGDRTSRWSESVYSRSSILDEDESSERRDRLLRRVEAMLDAERAQTQAYIPPLPKLPQPYSNIIHKPIGNAGSHSNISPGRSWNKF